MTGGWTPGVETTCITCDDNNIHHLQIFTLNYQDRERLVTAAGKQMMLTLNVVTGHRQTMLCRRSMNRLSSSTSTSSTYTGI